MNGDLASLRRFRLEIPLLAIVIVAIGIAYIQSASFDLRTGMYKPYASAQMKWLAISLAGFVVALAMPYQRIERYAWVLYGGVLALLLGVHVFGHVINGARSWYKLSESAKFQPSELAKIALICAVAKVLMYRKDMATVRPWLAVAAVAGPPLASILLEPDLGTVLVFGPALLAMLFVAGCNWRHLAALIGAGAAAGAAVFFLFFEEYQQKRILVFLNPELDPKKWGFQTLHSRIAIGSGGFWGQGYGEGPQTQRHILPENHTDFIFSVVGEEGGFVVAALLLLLLLALLLVCLDVAWRTREPFGRLVCVGIAALYAGQMVVNCGMTIGLCPVTGITLPFVSYGGSSLLTCFIALGLVANVAMRPVPTLADDFRRR
jgi:rod shape determining protein RodA